MGERTGWRDQAISRRHRDWGFNCPAVDLDFVLLEFNHGSPAAVVDYKHYAKENPLEGLNEWAIKAMSALYNERGENLPFFVARYWPDRWAFEVLAMNGTARGWLGEAWTPMTEQQWVSGLHRLRNLALTLGDKKQISRLNQEMPPADEAMAS
jgi:hypothetical protein